MQFPKSAVLFVCIHCAVHWFKVSSINMMAHVTNFRFCHLKVSFTLTHYSYQMESNKCNGIKTLVLFIPSLTKVL